MTIGPQKDPPVAFFSRIDHRHTRWARCECQQCAPTPRALYAAVIGFNLPDDFDTTGMHLLSVGDDCIAITPSFMDAERTFKKAVRDSAEDTVEWWFDCPLAGRKVRLGFCDPTESDPENVYNTPSIRQSIEEDRK